MTDVIEPTPSEGVAAERSEAVHQMGPPHWEPGLAQDEWQNRCIADGHVWPCPTARFVAAPVRFRAQIVETATGTVDWESGPESHHNAEKIARGAGINLNWDRFHTRIVPESTPPQAPAQAGNSGRALSDTEAPK